MIDVTCAIIIRENKILATQRGRGAHLEGFWEFPGGKIEPEESAEECIVREIFEELEIQVVVLRKLTPVEHHYPDKSIRLHPFICRIDAGEIRLKDHAALCWLEAGELDALNWAAADRRIVEDREIEKLNSR